MNLSKGIAVIIALAFPIVIFAQKTSQSQGVNAQSGQAKAGQGQQIIQNVSPTANMNQNENQVKNQGEEQMLQSREMETEQETEQGNGMGNTSENRQDQQYGQGRSDKALEKMSEVAKKVQELQTIGQTEGGLGAQIREIAQNQTQSQSRVQEQIQAMDSRQGIMKSLFGPDYKAMNQIRREIAENELRIRQMEDFANQLTNQSDAIKIREMIQSLIQQNTILQERLGEEEQVKSVFGWLMRLFQK